MMRAILAVAALCAAVWSCTPAEAACRHHVHRHHHHYRHHRRHARREGWGHHVDGYTVAAAPWGYGVRTYDGADQAWPMGIFAAPADTVAHVGVSLGRRIAAFYGRVTAAAEAAGVPLPIAHAVVRVESGYNPRARSSAGAVGIMQVLPRTAREMGENPYSLDGNLRAGMKYLRLALASSSDLCAAISAYEHGVAVRRPYCSRYGRMVLAIAAHERRRGRGI